MALRFLTSIQNYALKILIESIVACQLIDKTYW